MAQVQQLNASAKQSECALKPIAVRGSQIVRRPLKWLWPGRVPQGKLTLLVGDPDQGKSLLSIDMAARVSRGRSWPACAESETSPGSVVILTSEDEADDTLVPRLFAAEADLDRCVLLRAAASGARPFSLDRDLDVLRQTLVDDPSCRLVIIDPVSAYLARLDGNSNSAARSLLSPLASLAAERGVAVVMVNQLNKRANARAIHRALGSMAFVAVSRAAWLVARDPKDRQRRLLLSIKNNLAEPPPGIAFRIAPSADSAAKIEWDAVPVDRSLDDVLAQRGGPSLSERKYRNRENWAVTWLREQLRSGPVERKRLFCGNLNDGVSPDQLYRAARRLGVVMRKKGYSWDNAQWMLPEHAVARPSPEGCEEMTLPDDLPAQ